jgi:hypothetical protein
MTDIWRSRPAYAHRGTIYEYSYNAGRSNAHRSFLAWMELRDGKKPEVRLGAMVNIRRISLPDRIMQNYATAFPGRSDSAHPQRFCCAPLDINSGRWMV